MHETRGRNAVLIYVAPTAQTFAVLGDEAAYALCREDLWNEVREAMTADFKGERQSEGVVRAVKLVGEEWRRHFPRRPDDREELPNKVISDWALFHIRNRQLELPFRAASSPLVRVSLSLSGLASSCPRACGPGGPLVAWHR